jgi:hypothetical protein
MWHRLFSINFALQLPLPYYDLIVAIGFFHRERNGVYLSGPIHSYSNVLFCVFSFLVPFLKRASVHPSSRLSSS